VEKKNRFIFGRALPEKKTVVILHPQFDESQRASQSIGVSRRSIPQGVL
jgi:hypothetical protein